MGFLNEFAYGFSQAEKPILEDKAKYQAMADAQIREKMAEVDPEAELFARKTAIEAASKRQESQQQMADTMRLLQQSGLVHDTSMGQPQPATQDQSSAPLPTVDLPKPSAPNMAPSTGQPFMPTAAAPVDDDPYTRGQKFNNLAIIADASGNTHLATAAKIGAASADREYQHNKDLATEAEKPVLSAEGVNVGEQLRKDFETHLKGAGESSWYQPKSNQKPMSLPDAQAEEQEMFETIHAPLAQSFLETKKEKYPNSKVTDTYSSIKNDTTKATQAIVTLTSKDPNISEEDKKEANDVLAKTFKKVYGSPQGLKEAAAKDSHLQAIIDRLKEVNTEKPTTTPAKPTDGIPQVSSDADYADVPAGSQYKDPDGNIRTKPKAQ